MTKRSTCLCLLSLISFTLFAAKPSAQWSNIAPADLNLMGDYQGQWIDAPEKSYQQINPTVAAQVVNIDVGHYAIHFVQDLDRRAHPYFQGEGRLVGSAIVTDQDGWKFSVSAADGLTGTALIDGATIKFALRRVVRKSPTLNAPAPIGAITLFNGKNLDSWQKSGGGPAHWNLLDSGAMEASAKGYLRTRQTFQDVKLHLEFLYPVGEGKVGQKRGNSGVFLQGYEVQVLNSYGLEGKWNELGALYKLSPPRVNAARPPLQWQTFDITYQAPRYRGDTKIANARIWVELNGVPVQTDQEIYHATANAEIGRTWPAPNKPLPISLQFHGNPIQYRNIWVQELSL